jgi:hypothetical protein
LNNCAPEKLIIDKSKQYRLSLKSENHRARIFIIKQKEDLEAWYNSISNVIACLKTKQTAEDYDKYITEKEKMIANHEGETITNYNSLYVLLPLPEYKVILDQTKLANTTLWPLINSIIAFKSTFSEHTNHDTLKLNASIVIEELKKAKIIYPQFDNVVPDSEVSSVIDSISQKIYKWTTFDKVLERITAKEYTSENLSELGIPLTLNKKINFPLLKLKSLAKVQYGKLQINQISKINTMRMSEGISSVSHISPYASKIPPSLMRSTAGSSFIPYYDK